MAKKKDPNAVARSGKAGGLIEVGFDPASKSAIKCRIRSAVTRAEAAIAIATPLPR